MIYILEARQRVHKGGFSQSNQQFEQKDSEIQEERDSLTRKEAKEEFQPKKSGMALVFGFPTYRPCR